MQLNETWEDRPILSEQINYSYHNELIVNIVKRRPHLLKSPEVLYLTDTSLQYKDYYFEAARIIQNAIGAHRRIIIAGDYDVDGMTATAVLYSCLNAIHPMNISWWIPSREDGYGINAAKIQEFAEKNMIDSPLIITVDNGIAAAEEIAKLPDNYQVIVTDHHLAEGKELPECEYILNPKVFAKEEDDEYMISGCMVAAKLGLTVCELFRHKDSELTNYCEVLTGLSILSDMIPLNATVRDAMWLAMIALNVTDHPGLRALMTLSGFRYGSDITTNFLSFILIPKLNATGRMNRVDLGMKLLLDRTDRSEGNKDSLLLANDLINCNRSRKTIEDITLSEAFDLVNLIYHHDDNTLPSAIVVYKKDWLAGIIGIVAARLADLFKVPVICLTGEDVLHGSGRAPDGYDLYSGLDKCKDCLIQFGGHRVAGGLSLKASKLDEFRNKFSEVYAEQKDAKYIRYFDSVASIKDLKDVTFQLFLKRAEPFGNMNEPLTIRLNNVKVISHHKKGESLYLVLADNTDSILVSKYRAENEWYELVAQENIDILVTPNLTYFTGTTLPEYRAVSFKSKVDDDSKVLDKVKVFTNEEEYTKHVNGEDRSCD